MLVQIPIPATGGYANLGDGVILICAFLLDPLCAILAAGLGSMLADLIAGYIVYAPGTLIIKAATAMIAACIFGRVPPKRQMLPMRMSFASISAEAFMVLGYFFYEAIILGMGLGASGAIIGNVGQGIVGCIIACTAGPLLIRSDRIRKFVEKNKKS